MEWVQNIWEWLLYDGERPNNRKLYEILIKMFKKIIYLVV